MSYRDKFEIVDLSQEIFTGNSNYPIHIDTFIFVNKTHEQSRAFTGSELGFSARNLLMSEHCATHSDAVWEYKEDGETVDKMPMKHFWGPAICVDCTDVPEDRYIEIEDLQRALKAANQEIHDGDIFLIRTGAWERHYGEVLDEAEGNPVLGYMGKDAYQLHYTGLSESASEWLAKQGVVNIGVDSPAVDHPKDVNFSCHYICGKYDITNTENLCNLDKVVGKRFLYIGLPLRIRDGSGSPIRAVALVERD